MGAGRSWMLNEVMIGFIMRMFLWMVGGRVGWWIEGKGGEIVSGMGIWYKKCKRCSVRCE